MEDKIPARKIGMHTLRHYVDTLQGKCKTLNLLWWKWPSAHWDMLQHDMSVNLLPYPEPQITPNPPIDEKQQEIAAAFVEELLELEAVGLVPEGELILCNGPIMVIPKPDQPGEQRALWDMKKGGQNKHIAPDYVHYPCIPVILAYLSPGGYLAIVDVSKQFYHIPTYMQD
eukprot:2617041-Ditylum_brightwellii.AAC.1